ncbi:MAG TPA: hypothetical protein VJQ57_09880 [Acidimicrobiia bacterium]|nr:hypothetical protein [Acidimicrobiia bacterium]
MPSGIDAAELCRAAVVEAVVATTGLVGAGAVAVITAGLVELVAVELVDVELVVDELGLESSEPLAQARPVARSTAVTAAAARGIRYFMLDPPLV